MTAAGCSAVEAVSPTGDPPAQGIHQGEVAIMTADLSITPEEAITRAGRNRVRRRQRVPGASLPTKPTAIR